MEENKAKALQKLAIVQSVLDVPKGNYNKHGNFNYRSAEDINKALNPLKKEYNFATLIREEVTKVEERFYVKSTAVFIDCETGIEISAQGHAREMLKADRMNESQSTGSAGSYAKKYALNNLFAIDDNTDDPDNDINTKPKQEKPEKRWFNFTKRGGGINEREGEYINGYLQQGWSAAKIPI